MEERLKNKPADSSPPPLIRLEGVHKFYGKVHAVRGVDLEVYPGEVVGLIGDNGAGKTTLVKIVSGVIPKSRGKIFWKGAEVDITSVKKSRSLGIETVYQDRAVINELSVAQNVFMGREPLKSLGPIKWLDKDKMRKEALKLSRQLNLRIPSTEQEVRFCSGGEMQGVAISRAMYFKASLIILDEPTTALAVSGVRRVLDFIKRLKEENIACIFVSHNLNDVYASADRFVVMVHGKVIAEKRKDEVNVDDLINLQLTEASKTP
ncbi:MAG: ATP-binding cassette domain-containing protein [Spirochaetota bacterium]